MYRSSDQLSNPKMSLNNLAESYQSTSRISLIADKLGSIQVNDRNEKVQKLDELETRAKILEDQFEQFESILEGKLELVHENIGKISRAMGQQKQKNQQILDNKDRAVRDMDLRLAAEVDSLAQARKDKEQKVIMVVEEKVGGT